MPMRHALRELTRSGLRAVYELFRSALFWSRLATRVRTHFERALAAPSSGEPAKRRSHTKHTDHRGRSALPRRGPPARRSLSGRTPFPGAGKGLKSIYNRVPRSCEV
jgi:hypothetical protein